MLQSEDVPAIYGACTHRQTYSHAGVWLNAMETLNNGAVPLVDHLRAANRSTLPFLVWRDTSPQHFDTPLGEFNCDGCPEAQWPIECKVGPPPPSAHMLLNCNTEAWKPFRLTDH